MKKYDIPNCKYYVTEEGRLFNKVTNEEFIPTPNKNGYVYITIQYKRVKLHRIIAEAFIPNPDNKPQIDHINRNRLDNRVENLHWVTAQENSNNRTTNLEDGQRKQDLDFTDYKTKAHKKWRQTHRDEYNEKRRLRRHSMKTL